MKRIIALFLVLCTLTLSLVSCGFLSQLEQLGDNMHGEDEKEEELKKPETSEQLLSNIDIVMDALKSYSSSISLDATVTISDENGNELEISIGSKGKSVVANTGNGECDYYEQIRVTTKIIDKLNKNNIIEQSTVNSLKGYTDGMIFLSDVSEEKQLDRSICAKMTYKEFEEYESDGDMPDFFDVAITSQNVEMTEGEDGKFTLKTSKADRGYMDDMTNALELDAEIFGAIEDIEITVVADKDYRVERIDMKFKFDGKGMAEVEMSASETYGEYDTAAFPSDKLDSSEFVRIDSISLLDELDELFEKQLSSEMGSFNRKYTYTITPKMSTAQSYSEICNVKYKDEAPDYWYEMTVTASNVQSTITYNDGTLILPDGTAYPQTAEDARGTVKGLMDPIAFDSSLVKSVTKESDGRYIIKYCVADPDLYEEAASTDLKTSLKGAVTCEIILYTTAGQLTKYECTVKVDYVSNAMFNSPGKAEFKYEIDF